MAGAPDLTGTLGLLSLFDVGQLLLLTAATGELQVVREGRKGYFYFERGQIVNAVDDLHHEGEGAAYRLFTWKSGSFEFRAGAASANRAIAEGTEGLMMEAARRMDESGEGEAGGEAEKLARRAGSLESLREAFLSVANAARGVARGGGDARSPFALLRDPADALLLRPGRAPRLRLDGRWRDAGGPELDATAYEQLRARLLDEGRETPPAPATAGVRTRVAAHDDGRSWSVTRMEGAHEGLWIRPAAAAPAEVTQLAGPLPALAALLGAPAGLVLVGGPDAETADRLLHACVAQVAAAGATVLLLADHGRWAHADAGGALVPATRAALPELLHAIAPGVAAFDTAHADASPLAAGTAPLVLAAVVAPDTASLLPRWCARVGRRWGDGIEGALAGAAIGLVRATHAPEGGRIAFEAARIGGDATDANAIEALAPEGPAAIDAPAAAAAAAADEGTTTGAAPPGDAMAALAAELKRTLGRAA